MIVVHRGLLLALAAAEACSEDGVAEAGLRSCRPELPAPSTVAMIVGMVALRTAFFGDEQPSRDAIVDELVQASLHGFLHRHS